MRPHRMLTTMTPRTPFKLARTASVVARPTSAPNRHTSILPHRPPRKWRRGVPLVAAPPGGGARTRHTAAQIRRADGAFLRLGPTAVCFLPPFGHGGKALVRAPTQTVLQWTSINFLRGLHVVGPAPPALGIELYKGWVFSRLELSLCRAPQTPPPARRTAAVESCPSAWPPSGAKRRCAAAVAAARARR